MTEAGRVPYIQIKSQFYNRRKVSAIVESHPNFYVGVLKNHPEWTDYWIGPNRRSYVDARQDVNEQFERMLSNA